MDEVKSTGPSPDWYPDPEIPGKLRYWDGGSWTDHRRSVGATTEDFPEGSESADYEESEMLAPGAGYDTPTEVRPGFTHSALLIGALLVLVPLGGIFIVCVGLAVVSAYHAWKAGRAANRGEVEVAVEYTQKAKRWRRIAYISIPIAFVVAILIFLLVLGAAISGTAF